MTSDKKTKLRMRYGYIVCFCFMTLGASQLYAQDHTPDAMPRAVPICSGFNSETATWTPMGITEFNQANASCPAGTAVMAARTGSGPDRPLSQFNLSASCCPVPEGMLTDEHQVVPERCPVGFVVTGVHQHLEDSALLETEPGQLAGLSDTEKLRYFPFARRYSLRCTKINSQRFNVTDPKAGIVIGWYRHFRSTFEQRSSRSRIPLELRYGLGRASQFAWWPSFCVGTPWGSLLVGMGRKRCSEFSFVSVHYTGAPGDPPSGSPAVATAQCLYLEDRYSQAPVCMALP